MKKFYVIALTNGYVDTEGSFQPGTIISSHVDHFVAENKVRKITRDKPARVPAFGSIDSATPLTKGEHYPELAAQYLSDRFDRAGVYAMKCILDPAWHGGTATTSEQIGWKLDDLGLTVDELRARYEPTAKEELETSRAKRIADAERKTRIEAVGQTLDKERSQFTYTFPAVAGMQAGRVYYVAQIPFGALIKLFTFDDEDLVPAEMRAQRSLNESRAENIGKYVIENSQEYILPAITASVSSEMSFESFSVPGAAGSIGLLHIPMEATLLINDGQHRRRGIELALKQRRSLQDETIAVTIYFDQGLERSQQMFADINGKHVKPSSALNSLYDRRNPYNSWVLGIIKKLDLSKRIDLENSSVSAKSYKLWSLIAFKKFLTILTGISEKSIATVDTEQQAEIETFLVEFFSVCARQIPRWNHMLSGEISAFETREQLVIGHAVWLEALAHYARQALFINTLSFRPEGVIVPAHTNWQMMEPLAKINPAKDALMWVNRCVVLGKMQKTSDGVKSTTNKMLSIAGITLNSDQRSLESRLAA